MSSFSVDPTVLSTTAGSIRTQAGDINQRIDKVRSDVAATEGIWTGSARVRYVELMERWNRMATEVREELERTVALLNQAATDYQTTEAANARNFSG